MIIEVTKIFCINREKQQDLLNSMGAMYAAVFFLGSTNASAVQPVVVIERTVFYRERAAGMYSALPYAFAQVLKKKLKLSSFEKSESMLGRTLAYKYN